VIGAALGAASVAEAAEAARAVEAMVAMVAIVTATALGVMAAGTAAEENVAVTAAVTTV
jgi:hypothetical protein